MLRHRIHTFTTTFTAIILINNNCIITAVATFTRTLLLYSSEVYMDENGSQHRINEYGCFVLTFITWLLDLMLIAYQDIAVIDV